MGEDGILAWRLKGDTWEPTEDEVEGEGQVGLGADDTIPMPQPATLIDGVLADIMQRHGDKMVR